MVAGLFRWRLIWLALLAGALAGSALSASQLAFDFTPQYLFESDDADFVDLERLQAAFGRQDGLIAVVALAPDVLAEPVVSWLGDFTARLQALEGVSSASGLPQVYVSQPGLPLPIPVLTLASGEPLRSVVRAHPLIVGRVVSADLTATLVMVEIDSRRMSFEDLAPVVQRIQVALQQEQLPAGVQLKAAGVPLVRVEIVERMKRDQLTFMPLCGGIFMLLLWGLFRDARAMVVPLSAVAVSVLLLVGVMGAAGESINILNNVFPTLIFVIGISDAIHLIYRYREELAQGRDREKALHNTVRHLAVACFLTSFTTAIGFASLGVAEMDILRRFGIWAALGLMLAYVVTVVVVPLIFSFLDPLLPAGAVAADRWARRLGLRLAGVVLRYPRTILVVGVVVVGGFALVGSQVRVTNNLYEAFSPDDPLVEANQHLERHFNGGVPFSILVHWQEGSEPLRPEVLSLVRELADLGQAQPAAGGVFSLCDLLEEWNVARHFGDSRQRQIPESAELCRLGLQQVRAGLAATGQVDLVSRVYSDSERLFNIQLWADDVGARHLQDMFASLEAAIAQRGGRLHDLGLSASLSGDGYVASRGINRVIEDLFSSLLLAFVVILVVLVVMMRSLRTALVSMIPNLAPLVVTLGFMGLMGMELRVTSVIVFSISLGLAVDDTIHFMARFREEWARRPSYPHALRRTFQGTGKAIVVTTVVLAVGFAVLLTSEFPISRTFALCMEVTVLAALLGDLLILPASLLVLQPLGKGS